MAEFTPENPIKNIKGRISKSENGDIGITRQKSFGKNAKGEKLLGPSEFYYYHKHKGKWSEKVTDARAKFSSSSAQCKEELADPERLAYWRQRFEKQLTNPPAGEKQYVKFQCYVLAQIRKSK